MKEFEGGIFFSELDKGTVAPPSLATRRAITILLGGSVSTE
jgi:hypothetical protein